MTKLRKIVDRHIAGKPERVLRRNDPIPSAEDDFRRNDKPVED